MTVDYRLLLIPVAVSVCRTVQSGAGSRNSPQEHVVEIGRFEERGRRSLTLRSTLRGCFILKNSANVSEHYAESSNRCFSPRTEVHSRDPRLPRLVQKGISSHRYGVFSLSEEVPRGRADARLAGGRSHVAASGIYRLPLDLVILRPGSQHLPPLSRSPSARGKVASTSSEPHHDAVQAHGSVLDLMKRRR